MADQQKGKNRAAILQELESIKGLLVDEEDIPVLQEVIDNAEAQLEGDETLDDDELQELQQAYRDLLQAQETVADKPAAGTETPGLEPSESEAPVSTEVQTSLFDIDPSLPENEAGAPFDDAPDKSPEPEPEIALPPEPETRSSTARRPGVTKATGENPFLPAHIRARLHGNRPPPLFEPLTPAPIPKPQAEPSQPVSEASKISAPETRVKRALLTDELVTEFLPQIETALRERLQAMTEEQLQQLAATDFSASSSLSRDGEDDNE